MTLPPPLALLRPHQWVKNLFVAAALFFTPDAMTLASVGRVALAMGVFCLAASAIYIVNDWMDRAADRLHPEKCKRPLAAGTVSPTLAAAMFVGLLVGVVIGSWVLGPAFAACAAGYFVLNMAYSLKLKQVSILDVLIVASGFVLRVVAGAQAIAVHPSVWIIVCSGLLALFIALAKRRDDLVRRLGDDHRAALSGYNAPFIDVSLTVVLSALLVAYLIYTTEPEATERLGSEHLYLTVPWVVAGVLRYLQIIYVEQRSGAPTTIALTDRFIVPTVLGWIGTFAILIYA